MMMVMIVNLALAYISSSNSVMSFVEICVNNSFIFSVFTLILFQFWFYRDDNIVFFWDIILFIISTVIFHIVLVVVLWGLMCVIFRLLLLCISVRLECSCFSVFSVPIFLLDSCWFNSLFICGYIYNISRSENQYFFIIVLTWSASLRLVGWNLAHSSQISIILFV